MMQPVELNQTLPRDIENAIQVVEFEIRRKRKALDSIRAKTDPSENELIKAGREAEFIQNIERLIKNFRSMYHAHFGKMPPSDVELEKDVLGALMLERYTIDQVKSFLLPEHFYFQPHVHIYEAILKISETPEPISIISVKNHLRKTGHLDVVGGATYLVTCTQGVSSSAGVEFNSRILVEFAIKRQLMVVCARTCRNVYDDVQDAFELLDTTQDGVNECYSWIKK